MVPRDFFGVERTKERYIYWRSHYNDTYIYKINPYKEEGGRAILNIFSLFKSGYMKAKGAPALIPAGKIGSLKINGNQVIIVTVRKENSTTANVSFYIKERKEKWILDFSAIGYIGKNGIGKAKEGDNKTPVGLYHFTAAFGVAPKPAHTKIPYVKVNETHWLVSDPNSKYYNRFVSTSESKEGYPWTRDGYPKVKEADIDWDTSRGEQLYKYPKAYKYSLILNYNTENAPHKGSAIFLHCYADDKYTAGCVAIPPSKMKYLIHKLDVNNQNEIETPIIIDRLDNILKY